MKSVTRKPQKSSLKATPPLRYKRILLTCGPTWVALDPFRVVSNCSSGELGWTLAGLLKDRGAAVTLLAGPGYHRPSRTDLAVKRFFYFRELKDLLHVELKKKYHAVIHAAAVSDFIPEKASRVKIPSRKAGVVFRMKPAPKLIDGIKRQNPRAVLFGFKLTDRLKKQEAAALARDLIKRARCDWVAVNGFSRGRYAGFIIDRNGSTVGEARSRRSMAVEIVRCLSGHFLRS